MKFNVNKTIKYIKIQSRNKNVRIASVLVILLVGLGVTILGATTEQRLKQEAAGTVACVASCGANVTLGTGKSAITYTSTSTGSSCAGGGVLCKYEKKQDTSTGTNPGAGGTTACTHPITDYPVCYSPKLDGTCNDIAGFTIGKCLSGSNTFCCPTNYPTTCDTVADQKTIVLSGFIQVNASTFCNPANGWEGLCVAGGKPNCYKHTSTTSGQPVNNPSVATSPIGNQDPYSCEYVVNHNPGTMCAPANADGSCPGNGKSCNSVTGNKVCCGINNSTIPVTSPTIAACNLGYYATCQSNHTCAVTYGCGPTNSQCGNINNTCDPSQK